MNHKTNIKLLSAMSMALSLVSATALQAANYVVSNTNSSGAGSLSQALSEAQGDSDAMINLNSGLGTITLSGNLPQIQNNLVLNGNSNTISGAGAYRIFFVNAPGHTVQITALTLTDGLAQGGNGGGGSGGGGGGAGLGGAIFVNGGALTVSNVHFSSNSAHGGTGGIGYGGATSIGAGGGGGGGLGFGGGIGIGGTVNDGEDYEGPGGGGGALTSAGASASLSGVAGPGGGVNGGNSGASVLEDGNAGNGGSPSLPDGGGGGGGLALEIGNGGNGGNGSDFGGGGGAGSSAGGNSGTGGNGGFAGGGGGGAYSAGNGAPGGAGGFGGGGGGGGEGAAAPSGAVGGAGGFGAGEGDAGPYGNAGGGLGAGGAIFARLGSSLSIQDSYFDGDAVAGGSSSSADGSAIGQAVFLGGDLAYSVSAGTNAISETIGGGTDPNAQGNFTKSGAGTLVLTAAESYVGSTTVSAGTLEIVSNILLSKMITIDTNAVLEYNYDTQLLQPSTTYTGAGTLRVAGSGEVVFGPGVINLNFSPGALVDVESGNLTGSSSYAGRWTQNQASLNVAVGAVFNIVEGGDTGAMQIDALTGGGTFLGGYSGNANGLTTVTIGVAGGSGLFSGRLQNNLGGRLGVVKTGAGVETLSGSNTYTGGTTVNGGTLLVNGTNSGAVTVTGGVLGGAGLLGGAVTIGTNAALAPGAPLGTLTINNTLSLAGNTLVGLNSGSNSQVAGLTSVTYGGTLTITNFGAPLSTGNAFTLFRAASWSGNFSSIVGSAGEGLNFAFNPTNGVLSVVGTFPSSPTNLAFSVSASAMTLSWPSSYTGWILQAQTNPPSMGITTNWTDVAGSATVDSMTFTITHSNSVFFRLRLP